MTYVLTIQKVEEYDKWKQVFDEHGKVRKAEGSKGELSYIVINIIPNNWLL